jgi:Integrase zinc binding domain
VFSPLQLGNLPTLSLVLSAEPSVNTTSATFPVSDQSSKADEDISQIQDYLTTLKLPSNLSEDALAKFLRKVKQFSLIDGQLWWNFSTGRPQMFIPPSERLFIVRDAHDRLGHKGIYSTRRTILDRFWWPSVDQDIKWYVDTCHECQIRQTTKVRIPPTVDKPAPLFRKVYIDTMLMPLASGFRYIVQARCSLSTWPEWRALQTETGRTIGSFIFEDILCRWGAVEEIVTDNGTAYIATLDWLASKFGIRHIRISAYNSRANGIVERQHRTIHESLVKACQSDVSRWPTVVPHVFWADRATVRKSTSHSPFYMAHGVEPLLPFDITLATFLVPDLVKPLSTADLLAICARQLEKREDDLASIRDNVLKARHASIRQFERQFQNTIRDHPFRPGDLVLVRNSAIETDLGRKVNPRYLGPMVVVRRTFSGSYRLAELDGAVSKLRYATFHLIPYHARSHAFIPVTRVLDRDDLVNVVEEEDYRSNEDDNERRLGTVDL